ncbi:hypothetical protein V9K92_13645 [Phyllobacterium sp. CCNWLW109]
MFIHRQMPPDKVIGCEPDSTYRTTQGEQQTLQETNTALWIRDIVAREKA